MEKLTLFQLSEQELYKIYDSLDQTGGVLIKEGELKYWIEKFVNDAKVLSHIKVDKKIENWKKQREIFFKIDENSFYVKFIDRMIEDLSDLRWSL